MLLRIAIFLGAILFWFGGVALADNLLEAGFAARCSPPTGDLLEFGWKYGANEKILRKPSDGFRSDVEGFSNMNPVFIYDPDEPEILTSIWGDTRPDYIPKETLDKHARTMVDENVVIQKTDRYLSAVYTEPNEAWLSTLYPALGLGYFTYHSSYSGLFAPEGTQSEKFLATSATMRSKCTFSQLAK